MSDKKIIMLACCKFGVNVLEYLIENNITISQLVCLTPEQAKKNNVSGYYNYEQLAKKYNIPVYYPDKYSMKSEECLNYFKKNKFEVLILGGWQRLIPNEILLTLKHGGLGIHGSSEFLPEGRGRSPVNWSLIEGKKRFILHLFKMKPEADNGDIIDYEMFDINEHDTCETLYKKISIVTKKMLLNALENLDKINTIKIPQIGESTYYPKRTPADGKINWELSHEKIYNFIRALTFPYPGAFCFNNSVRINIWEARPFDTRISYYGKKYGEVVEIFEDNNFIVNCRSGLLIVTKYDGIVKKGDILI
ncbi:MAG: methionyl-tRNA formyltransferase [Saprospiraceae bacterium]|nr:methionyl-tRNA formyltransferase [Saprospiraceae bacterium]